MVEDTPAEEGTDSNNEEGQGSAMSQVGLSESDPEAPGPQEDEAAPAEPPPPLPPSLPHTTVADFGFTTENTAMFMGLHCLSDMELFVPVLRLILDKSEEATVADIFAGAFWTTKRSTRNPFLRRSCSCFINASTTPGSK